MSPAAFSPVPTLPELIGDHDRDHESEGDRTMGDFNATFDFNDYVNDFGSPKTISPHTTPSPVLTTKFKLSDHPFRSVSPHASGSGSRSDDGDMVNVKEEPMDFSIFNYPTPAPSSPFKGFAFDTNEIGSSFLPTSTDSTSPPLSSSAFDNDTYSNASYLSGIDMPQVPPGQQAAFDQLMKNYIAYQSTFGASVPSTIDQTPPPTTIEPSLVFSNSPTNTFTTSATSSAMASGSNTGPYNTPTQSLPPIRENGTDNEIEVDDDEPLRSVEPHEISAPIPGPSRKRTASVFSGTSDISARLDRLAPREAIFSAGKGKGGKKGGGLSSVVRGDDEDLDDDDSWRPSPEEYKKLSSKEKRQLRNKLSARAFRTRRKDYIGTLEGHIKDRDDVIDEMRSELVHTRNENRSLREELEAMKAHTLKILHPASAGDAPAPPLPIMSNLLSPKIASKALSPQIAVQPIITSSPEVIVKAPSPKIATRTIVPTIKRTLSSTPISMFNPRKDLASSSTEVSRSMWSDRNMFGGGSTSVHHAIVPPPVFKQANMNPLINSETVESTPAPAMPTSAKDISIPFHEWTENNNFNLRSMDAYRMQIWSRLTREAQAEKDKVPMELRPKFLVESTSKPAVSDETNLATQLATAATSHITSKLASSFWSAFSGPSSVLDTDKLSAVITGTAKLAVIPSPRISHHDQEVISERTTTTTGTGVLDEEGLMALMGGLKLQTGLANHGHGHGHGHNGVRENPLGVFSTFIKSAGCPTRA